MLNSYKKTSLVTIFIFTLIHGIALLAAYRYFSLEGMVLLVVTHALFCMLSIIGISHMPRLRQGQ